MKALFVNGSPRKNWSTVKMLERAMQGAMDAGAEVEMVDYKHRLWGTGGQAWMRYMKTKSNI